MKVKGGPRFGTMLKNYKAGETYRVKAVLSTDMHAGTYYINDKNVFFIYYCFIIFCLYIKNVYLYIMYPFSITSTQ